MFFLSTQIQFYDWSASSVETGYKSMRIGDSGFDPRALRGSSCSIIGFEPMLVLILSLNISITRKCSYNEVNRSDME